MEDRSKDKYIQKNKHGHIQTQYRVVPWNYSMELREREEGKENNRASVISHNIRCEGRGYKNVY
jgi:hypothetical protein